MVGQQYPVTVDCRWIGFSGVGRFTEMLLEGLAQLQPTGRWTLWGRPEVRKHQWPGASVVPTMSSPLSMFGQRARPPHERGSRFVFPHLVRPLHVRTSLVVAHDTIPVRWASPGWHRPLQRAFYWYSVHTAAVVVAYSDATAARLQTDLRVDAADVRRVPLGVELGWADRVLERRSALATTQPVLLYVGIDRPHKNLLRAFEGFRRSRFCADGGRFVIVGVQDDHLDALRAAAEVASTAIEVRGRCDPAELEQLLAGARVLIQPSLEEGLGLTVIEALAAGVPTTCSGGTALEEAARGFATLFDPRDPGSIANAIDTASECRHEPRQLAQGFRRSLGPAGPRELASAVISALDGAERGTSTITRRRST